MSSHLLLLLLANVLMVAVGCGLLPILRLARTRRELVARLPLAYPIGLVVTGTGAAVLAIAGLEAGPLALVLLAALSVGLGLPGLPPGERRARQRPGAAEACSWLLLVLTAVLAARAARVATVKPLLHPPEWQIWATRAKALFLFGHAGAPVFTDPSYHGLRQPLLLPALEALDFHFTGAFDGTLLHVQLFLFAVAFAGGAWVLLRAVTGPVLLSATLLAIFAAPAFSEGLLTNTAAVPTAVLAGLGVAALAAWLRAGDGSLLAAAAVLLAAGALTSSEGECLVLAALAAAAIAAPRGRLRSLVPAAVFVLVLDFSWRAWLTANHVGAGGQRHSAASLWHAFWSTGAWSLLAPFVLVGLAGGLIERHFRRVVFVAGWLALSFAALLLQHAGTPPAASGTAGALLVGGALLVPFLLHAGTVVERAPAPVRAVEPLVQGQQALAALAASAVSLYHRLRLSFGLPHRTPETLRVPTEDAPRGSLPWRRPRRELALLALVAAATLTPIFATNSQDASRVCLARAVLHLHVSSTYCLSGPYGGDRAKYDGRLYSDKAPGMALLDVPAVVIARVPSTYSWPYWSVRLWFVRVVTSGLALIVCAFLIGRISEGLAPGYGGISLVAFALGTLVAPFGASNFEHVTAGMLGLSAFALAWGRRPLLAGLTAGLALLVAYEAATILCVLAVYLVVTQGRRRAGRFLAGSLPGWLVLAAYDWAAFGDPWHLSYSYKADQYAAQQSSGFFGIHLPYLHAIREVFLGRGGLLFISPIVFAAAYGLFLLGRRWKAEAIVCGAVVIVFLFIDTGYYDSYGGLSPGPRYFIPALPFLALGLGPAFAAHFRFTSLLTVLSIVPEMALMLTWSVGAPDGSIWHHLADLPGQIGSSWIVGSLSGNVLQLLDASRGGSAVFVALAAAAAFALALPLTFRRPAS